MKTVIVAGVRSVFVLAAAVALGGCGGGGQQAVETVPRPTLPHAVAEDLAARSDAVAEALDAGDVCTAAVRADELQHAVVDAINSGRVPQAFQEDLSAHANELVNAVNCPQPPAPTTTENDNEKQKKKEDEKKEGEKKKKKEEDKGGGDEGGDEPVITVPTVTGVVP